MDANTLHVKMIEYIFDNQLFMLAFTKATWWKFKNVDGVPEACGKTAAELVAIFRHDILPNIRSYECVTTNEWRKAYIDRHDNTIAFVINNPNDDIILSSVELDESEVDNARDGNPIVTHEIMCLSHVTSTRTEVQRGDVRSIKDSTERLRYIKDRVTGGDNAYKPTPNESNEYYAAVHRRLQLDESVSLTGGLFRLNDIVSNNLETITPQNLPIMLLDSRSSTEQIGGAIPSNLQPIGGDPPSTASRVDEQHPQSGNLSESSTFIPIIHESLQPIQSGHSNRGVYRLQFQPTSSIESPRTMLIASTPLATGVFQGNESATQQSTIQDASQNISLDPDDADDNRPI